MKQKILITGGAGYIGSMLATELVYDGHDVTVIDLLKYDKNSLNHLFFYKNFTFIKCDVRNTKILNREIKKCEIVIPLAALVGAPLCEKNKKMAKQINLEQIKNILKILNKKQKIIYLNSNSGYGIGKKNSYCDENSALNPISLYGRTKVQSEKEVCKHDKFVCLRLATVFGFSYRMRTDLLVNFFVKESIEKKNLKIFEPHFRRNYIHVRDVVGAIKYSISNFNKMKNEIYNLGLSSANLTKIELAKKVKKMNKKIKIKIIKNIKDPDQRDYYVSNAKIESKGFKAKLKVEDGIKEVYSVLLNSNKKIINNY
jgi:nucleoside-diphosphate-sugar epimerase